MTPAGSPWRLPLGATPGPHGLECRVWAPHARQVEIVMTAPEAHRQPLQLHDDGLWQAVLPGYSAGTRYAYSLDGAGPFPDPYSRSQPEGVHGPSEVIDPLAYAWHDHAWGGLDIKGLVIYECHIGTMTPAGTCAAIIPYLPYLRDLGVNALQLLPVAACPGRRNWGYDGVGLFAVSGNYGGAEALKRLVDAAHQHGLGVILDVVYNHLGPEGNYLKHFAPEYFSSRHRTPWGETLNFDGPHNHRVRQFVLDNALYWLHEYHLDGLRLDSTSNIFDRSTPHLLQELAQTVRASVPRDVVLIAETSANEVRYLQPWADGGHGFDAVWCDDFAWSILCYLTGDHEGRYQDYQGTLQEVARTINQGFLYEGQWSVSRQTSRGTMARQQPAWQLQYCLQHHDHVGNRALGERLHHRIDLPRYRVASTVLLLLPYTPLLFMGQEFAASSPFLFFTDHSPALGRLVSAGRRREFASYSAFADPAAAARIPDPQDSATWQRSRLLLAERQQSPGAELLRLYRALLYLRRHDTVLQQQNRHGMQAQALTADLLAVVWHETTAWRLLLANFGAAVTVEPDALTAPALGWRVLLESTAAFLTAQTASTVVRLASVELPAQTAVLLAADDSVC